MTRITYRGSAGAQCQRMVPAMAYDVFSAVHAAFESLGKAVVFLDDGLRIVSASPGFRGLAGAPEIEGKLVTELVDGPEFVDCIQRGARCQGEVRMRNGRMLDAAGGVILDGAVAESARYVIAFDLEDANTSGDASDEAERILRALEANRWRRSEAARALGISRATLWRRMREFRIL